VCWSCVGIVCCYLYARKGGGEGLLSSTENSSHVVGNHVITSLDRSIKHGSFDCSTRLMMLIVDWSNLRSALNGEAWR
jgi:hypothetical protein